MDRFDINEQSGNKDYLILRQPLRAYPKSYYAIFKVGIYIWVETHCKFNIIAVLNFWIIFGN